jgi:hypothetical protein
MIAALGEEISGNCSVGLVMWGFLAVRGERIDAKGEEKRAWSSGLLLLALL